QIGGPHRVDPAGLGVGGDTGPRRPAEAQCRVIGQRGRVPGTRYNGGFCHRVSGARHRGVRGVAPPGENRHGRRTVARARVSTFAPAAFATMSTVTLLSASLSRTLPLTSMVAPSSSSGTG